MYLVSLSVKLYLLSVVFHILMPYAAGFRSVSLMVMDRSVFFFYFVLWECLCAMHVLRGFWGWICPFCFSFYCVATYSLHSSKCYSFIHVLMLKAISGFCSVCCLLSVFFECSFPIIVDLIAIVVCFPIVH